MVRAYGKESFTLSFVKKWKVKFYNGRTNIEDAEKTGRLGTFNYYFKQNDLGILTN